MRNSIMHCVKNCINKIVIQAGSLVLRGAALWRPISKLLKIIFNEKHVYFWLFQHTLFTQNESLIQHHSHKKEAAVGGEGQ